MGSQKLLALVFLVVGVILFYFGWQSSQSVGEQLMETVTGRFTDETTWYLIAGAVAVVIGGALLFSRK